MTWTLECLIQNIYIHVRHSNCSTQRDLLQGALRVNRFNSAEGWVGSESVGQDILIPDRIAMNRAMDGDIVAIELLPEVQPH